jgi:hypothetical protein
MVKLPGGVNGAPLPTYTEILTLTEQGLVYANISDTEHPELHTHPSAKTEETGHGDALIELDAEGHAKWYAHLDDRYKEHRGKFRPEIA